MSPVGLKAIGAIGVDGGSEFLSWSEMGEKMCVLGVDGFQVLTPTFATFCSICRSSIGNFI